MMQAVSMSETSDSVYKTTQRNVAEDSNIHTFCNENLKSHGKEYVY
jgi:hypothetical protein